jgi:hypothetical protein
LKKAMVELRRGQLKFLHCRQHIFAGMAWNKFLKWYNKPLGGFGSAEAVASFCKATLGNRK